MHFFEFFHLFFHPSSFKHANCALQAVSSRIPPSCSRVPEVCSVPGEAILTGDPTPPTGTPEAALAAELLKERNKGSASFFETYISSWIDVQTFAVFEGVVVS